MTADSTQIAIPRDIDVAAIKADFPILSQQVNGHLIRFLDSAASSQKPVQVLDAMDHYYRNNHANVHRAAYTLAEVATDALEAARTAVARFINATKSEEIIFTKNATESLNLVAQAWGGANLTNDDVVVLTHLEHHANIVPWLQLQAQIGFEIRWIHVDDAGLLDLSNVDELLDGAKVLALTAMSNVVGTLTPVAELAAKAHAVGAIVVVDACQFTPHLATDVHALGADFLAFSSHKMLGPTGIGVLWGKESLLEAMPPFLGGGGMILDVKEDSFIPADLPHKFEAGTPPIAEAIGLHAAIDYLNTLGMDAVRHHEVVLNTYAINTLTERFGERIIIHGSQDPELRGGAMSLAFDDVHPHDLSQVLNQYGVCVRPGHHCAKPLMRHLEVGATARASWYIYNDESDIDALADALEATGEFFLF